MSPGAPISSSEGTPNEAACLVGECTWVRRLRRKLYFSTTCSGGCLGSSSGEGRSELRYAQRCAEFRELQSVERMAPHGSAVRYVWLGVLFFSSPADFGSLGRIACHFFAICEVACWECLKVCTRVAFQRGIQLILVSAIVALCATPEICEIYFASLLDPSSDWVTR